MARLEDKLKPGLPPPPAPPKRAANPWKFSETARKPEPRPESIRQQLLDELMEHAQAEETHVEVEAPPQAAPTQAAPAGGRPGLWFLAVAGIAVLIVARIFFEARKGDDWVGMLGPLIAIAFIAHGWWRFRQRREAKKIKPD